MLVRQLNIDVEFKRVNLFKMEHLAPEFVKVRMKNGFKTVGLYVKILF